VSNGRILVKTKTAALEYSKLPMYDLQTNNKMFSRKMMLVLVVCMLVLDITMARRRGRRDLSEVDSEVDSEADSGISKRGRRGRGRRDVSEVDSEADSDIEKRRRNRGPG